MTLNQFINQNDYVILFTAGIGFPSGNEFPLGYPDIRLAEDCCLLELRGVVEKDQWEWDGFDKPKDYQGNSFTKIQAYSNETKWNRLTDDYERNY